MAAVGRERRRRRREEREMKKKEVTVGSSGDNKEFVIADHSVVTPSTQY